MQKRSIRDEQEDRRHLVQQVASSAYLSRSSRLREMFLYVCTRVLDESADEIHEQEVGQEVFGRPANYDTAADNTVRVHASMLRKRVGQYFENEGSNEPLVIEIPRGNYAPVFRERAPLPPFSEPSLPEPPMPENPSATETARPHGRRPAAVWISMAVAIFFAATTVFFFLKARSHAALALRPTPVVANLWSQIFPNGKQTDLVLGDASLGIVQELTGEPVELTNYFDRSYLTQVNAGSKGLNPALVKSLLLKRQTNYGDVALLARMTAMAHAVQSDTRVRFSRDYSFHELKTDNVILFGSADSDLWIQPFLGQLTLRWKFDSTRGGYYPTDVTAKSTPEQFNITSLQDGSHVGFATLSLLPNLSGSGNVLILSATGGTTMNAAVDFLSTEGSIRQLRERLIPKAPADTPLPYFEALLRTNTHGGVPHSDEILIVRRIR